MMFWAVSGVSLCLSLSLAQSLFSGCREGTRAALVVLCQSITVSDVEQRASERQAIAEEPRDS